ncbi:MAG: MFS transporter [Gemmatimonadota bacterium]|jgi:DHA1 family tetracycline resistance protein-like MFS transporter
MLRTSRLAILFVTVLVDMVGFGIVLPLLPFYAESFGASALEVTLLVASFSAMQFVAVPIWGRISDRLGRRPFIIAGLFASAVSYLIFGLAQSLLMLFVSRIAAGAAGGTISVAQAYVADTTGPEDRAHGMGMLGAASGLGILIGPAIGGYFSTFGYAVPGFIAAVLCAANGLAALFFLPESRPRAGPRDASDGAAQAATIGAWLVTLTRYPFALLLTVYFFCIMPFTAMTSVLALYAERAHAMDAMDMGIVFATAGGTTVVVRGLIVGWLARRFGERRIVQAGTVVLSASLLTIPLVPGPGLMFLLVPFWALATGLTFPSLASLVSRETDRDSQGAMLGGQQVVGGIARVLGPVWAGAFFEQIGIASPFFIGAGLVALAAVLALRIPAPSGPGHAGEAALAVNEATP